jgi:YVTN family beta-propeller protein
MTRHACVGVTVGGIVMTVRNRARMTFAAGAALALAAALAGCSGDGEGDSAGLVAATTPPPSASASPAPSASAPPPGGPAAGADDGPPSAERELRRVTRITGGLTPKSVVASSQGDVVAQNMIYTHTVSVYDTDHELVTTIKDRITPSEWGFDRWTKPVKGGPVEASFSPDGEHLWVSNYSMYGPGFEHPGDDVCSPSGGVDRSFLYRVDTSDWKIDGVVRVGAVPKFVEATPDGRTVLVTNWCTWDLSVVDASSLKEKARIDLGGRYPRGIAITADSRTAYVAIMGGTSVVKVDLERAAEGDEDAVEDFSTPGGGPRHLNLSPDGTFLYVTLNKDGRVAKVDARTGKVVKKVSTGSAPRSSVLSPDGTALFVVNYESDTVSQVRTRDMKVLSSENVDHHPIGITYNPKSDEVWVASYVGSITVFADRAPKDD